MTEEKPAGHPHAALMIELGNDGLTCSKPWLLWQEKSPATDWRDCTSLPLWFSDFQYRRKPRTIKIGDCEIQVPERVAPALGSPYWIPVISLFGYLCEQESWGGDNVDVEFLSRGLVHLTEESAEAHAKALIALTAIK